jgi:hypothetical protein
MVAMITMIIMVAMAKGAAAPGRNGRRCSSPRQQWQKVQQLLTSMAKGAAALGRNSRSEQQWDLRVFPGPRRGGVGISGRLNQRLHLHRLVHLLLHKSPEIDGLVGDIFPHVQSEIHKGMVRE